MIDFSELTAPFPPSAVSWRVGSTTSDKTKGMALAYIDARDVMDRLDTVCGPAGWECRYPHTQGKTVCEITIWCGDRWVTKSDGAGDTDVEKEKGALSDAFKRAAVRWGIGRYLYHLPSPWVRLEAAGRSYKIADGEMRNLERLLATDAKANAPQTDAKADYAIAQMTRHKTADEFRDFWGKNKDALKAELSPAEYGRVVTAMQTEAKRLAPPKDETPFDGESE